VDALAGNHADDGALGVLALADAVLGTTGLALAVDRVHTGDLDPEDLLDGDLDLGLVGVRVDQERVLVVVEQAVALLADHGGDQDVPCEGSVVRHQFSSWAVNPAASALSALSNQTVASVVSYASAPGAT